jgi:hypothetical protein
LDLAPTRWGWQRVWACDYDYGYYGRRRVLSRLGLQFRPDVLAIGLTMLPKRERDRHRIDVEPMPPSRLITRPVKLAVMDPANRNGELVTHSVSKCTRLCKRQVVRIRRHSAAHKAGLPSHELPVLLIAQANCFSQSTNGRPARPLLGHCGSFLAVVGGHRVGRYHLFARDRIKRPRYHQAERDKSPAAPIGARSAGYESSEPPAPARWACSGPSRVHPLVRHWAEPSINLTCIASPLRDVSK